MVNPPQMIEATCRAVGSTVRMPTQAVPANYKRNIYWYRAMTDPTSRRATVRLIAQERTSGATVRNKDVLIFTTRNETQTYPDELKRDSLPIWMYNPGSITRFQAQFGTVLLSFKYAEEME